MIDMVTDHDSDETIDYSNEDDGLDFCIPVAEGVREAVANPHTTAATVPVRVVPKTIEDLWVRVKGIQATGDLDPPACTHGGNCPYSNGPLMRQRYNLMCRLVELEHFLYGV